MKRHLSCVIAFALALSLMGSHARAQVSAVRELVEEGTEQIFRSAGRQELRHQGRPDGSSCHPPVPRENGWRAR